MKWRPRSRNSRPLTRRRGDEGSPGLQRVLSAHAGTGAWGAGHSFLLLIIGQELWLSLLARGNLLSASVTNSVIFAINVSR